MSVPLPFLPPLSQLLSRPRTALGVFVPAGLSEVADEADMLGDLSRSGAALFEIGAPAADPVLDGPVIASAYRQALRRGTGLPVSSKRSSALRAGATVVVAYWASLQQHGVGRIAGRLAAAGACGVMVPDLPADQAVAWQQTTGSVGLLAPALVPARCPRRLGEVAAAASGWLYAPANAGPTGYRGPLDTLPSLRKSAGSARSALPIVAGIGVSTPAKAAAVAPLVDAVIIGTPIVRALTTTPHNAPQLVADFAASVSAHQVHRG
ncbi:tryptophan synthase subunit alpha [Streptomyces albulus]|nr:tryptophan synthase subunit alpha [Streptomyces noursei]